MYKDTYKTQELIGINKIYYVINQLFFKCMLGKNNTSSKIAKITLKLFYTI